jgi:hypothetical protein
LKGVNATVGNQDVTMGHPKTKLVISKENITKLEKNSFRQTVRVNVRVMNKEV